MKIFAQISTVLCTFWFFFRIADGITTQSPLSSGHAPAVAGYFVGTLLGSFILPVILWRIVRKQDKRKKKRKDENAINAILQKEESKKNIAPSRKSTFKPLEHSTTNIKPKTIKLSNDKTKPMNSDADNDTHTELGGLINKIKFQTKEEPLNSRTQTLYDKKINKENKLIELNEILKLLQKSLKQGLISKEKFESESNKMKDEVSDLNEGKENIEERIEAINNLEDEFSNLDKLLELEFIEQSEYELKEEELIENYIQKYL